MSLQENFIDLFESGKPVTLVAADLVSVENALIDNYLPAHSVGVHVLEDCVANWSNREKIGNLLVAHNFFGRLEDVTIQFLPNAMYQLLSQKPAPFKSGNKVPTADYLNDLNISLIGILVSANPISTRKRDLGTVTRPVWYRRNPRSNTAISSRQTWTRYIGEASGVDDALKNIDDAKHGRWIGTFDTTNLTQMRRQSRRQAAARHINH